MINSIYIMTLCYPYDKEVVYDNDTEYQYCIANIIKNYTEWHSMIEILYNVTKTNQFRVLFDKVKKRHILATSDRNCILLLMSYDYYMEFHKCLHGLHTNNNVEFLHYYHLLLQKMEKSNQ